MTEIIRILDAYKCSEQLPNKRCKECPYGYGYLDESGDNMFWWCDDVQMTADAMSMLQKIVGVLVNGK